MQFTIVLKNRCDIRGARQGLSAPLNPHDGDRPDRASDDRMIHDIKGGTAMAGVQKSLVRVLTAILMVMMISSFAPADDLALRSCPELVKMAQSYQDDLKAVGTVLGSAIDSGSIERVRKYKLKRSEIKKNLDIVMNVLSIKGCVK
jgi:hypothetical protein